MAIVMKTRVFELYNGIYKNITELARVMGISRAQAYRVRKGQRQINERFIVGALRAFPEYRLEELFYTEISHE